ncbi:hypothetical protein A3860_21730 [Niastella vici]|uniref:Thioredoxin domain-containing protein n=1 Tax=Niastella vici TaxID=1703345 RepID=A0A1V9G0D7_9BACT|nr:TlpA disulfide reductase family protein [Niastella vici]OQP64040.1 hypothetical protein A3860_21730 [Niastella vici]
MKKMIVFFLIPFLAFTPHTKPVIIKGRVQSPDPVKKIYLSFRTKEGAVNDSAVLLNGRFQFKEQVAEPTLATFVIAFEKDNGKSKDSFDYMKLFLEPGQINISIRDSLKSARVTGSKAHTAFEQLTRSEKPFTDAQTRLRPKYFQYQKENNKAGMEQIEQQYDSIETKKKEEVWRSFVVNNPGSPIAFYVLKEYAGVDINVPEIGPLFDKLPASVKNSPSGVEFKQQLEVAKNTSVGAYALDFTQNDTLDNPVSLSSFRGKYVLLDFWASWCGPCRAENPNVAKAFNQYKDKNFTVLSVSLDAPGKKQAWLDAIHKDGLTWTHVSDLKRWNNAVAKLYGIMGIPQNFLIDPQGKIIAKNLKGEKLNKKLEEVLSY